MEEETAGAESSESGESRLSQVEAEAFNDTTPLEDYGKEANEEETTDTDTSDSGQEQDGEDGTDEVDDEDSASFTDLEAANKHVKKLNRENARRRNETKEYESAFGKYDPESRSRLLEIVSTLAEDPEAGAHELVAVAKRILGEDALKEPEFDPDKPMTFKEYEELKSREKAQAKEEARQQREHAESEEKVKQIFSKVDELGYKENTPERHTLLSIAAADEKHGGTRGNLDKAHEKVEALRQQWIQEYIEGKSSQRAAFPATGEGAAPAEGKGPKTWADFVDQATEMGNAAQNIGR